MDRCVWLEQSIRKSSVIRLLLVSDVQPRHAQPSVVDQFIKQSRVYFGGLTKNMLSATKSPQLVQINYFLNRSVQMIYIYICIFSNHNLYRRFFVNILQLWHQRLRPSLVWTDASDVCGSWNETRCHVWSSYAKCVCSSWLFTPQTPKRRHISGCPAPKCSSVFSS